MKCHDEQSLELFRNLVRIPSISHLGPLNGTYAACVTLLEKEARERGFLTRVHDDVPGKPLLVVTKLGLEPELSSLLLNSHYDVVPAEASLWKLAPLYMQTSLTGSL